MKRDRDPPAERDDLVELCGGEGRPTIICARRKLKCGGNFDLITGTDLNKRSSQEQVITYMKIRRPIVVVMAPSCTAFGPPSSFNKVVNPEAWKRACDACAPHGIFCGHIAKFQLSQRREWDDDSAFLCEQPHPTTLYDEPPWPEVLADESVSTLVFHQCMTGQVGATGIPKKTTKGMTS